MEYFLICILNTFITKKLCPVRHLIIMSALCLAAILVGSFYTLIDGIICGSYLGVILSLACIAALFMGLRYFKKMVQQVTEEESY